MKDITNVIYFMRRRMNLTQREIAEATGLTLNDISRAERGVLKHQIKKIVMLSTFFCIPLEAILRNNLKAAVQTFKTPTKVSRRMKERIKAYLDRCDDIGCKGEDWVFQKEVEKLKGTCYANGVNPNFSDDEAAAFDILSFSLSGESIIIEVKTTPNESDEPFFFSSDELKIARECYENGRRYEVHRVHNINNPNKRGREIISAEELFSNYNFIPVSYKVVRKESKTP
jgi:transcriptional regulator with XRE-family HTH domain